MEKEDQREYEKKLIEEGRAFELDKIIRAEEFQKDILESERELDKRYTEKDFAKEYEGDTLQYIQLIDAFDAKEKLDIIKFDILALKHEYL